jgi:hypothetical protein
MIQCTNSGTVWISIADTNLRYNLKKSHTRKIVTELINDNVPHIDKEVQETII